MAVTTPPASRAAVLTRLPVAVRLPRAVWAFSALAAVLTTAFGVAFARHVGAPAAEVALATYLAAAGTAVVPLALLLAPRAVVGAAGAAVAAVALVSAAAATVHFAAIDKQAGGYWLFALAFAVLAVFQLVW